MSKYNDFDKPRKDSLRRKTLERGSEEWFVEICRISEDINYLLNAQCKEGLVIHPVHKYIPSQIEFAERFANNKHATVETKKRLCTIINNGIKRGKSYLKDEHVDEDTLSIFDKAISKIEETLL